MDEEDDVREKRVCTRFLVVAYKDASWNIVSRQLNESKVYVRL